MMKFLTDENIAIEGFNLKNIFRNEFVRTENITFGIYLVFKNFQS